jgi:hypothetical protein
MLYALLAAAGAGFVGRDRVARIQHQVDLLVWRTGADLELMNRFYRQQDRNPKAFWYETDAKLKLLGHAGECLAFNAAHNVAKLTPAQQAQRQAAVAALERLLTDLAGRNLEEARGLAGDLYRQLIGDACHARHGLNFA